MLNKPNILIISSDEKFINLIKEQYKINFYFVLEKQFNFLNDKNELVSELNIIKKIIEDQKINQVILDFKPNQILNENFDYSKLEEIKQFIFKFHEINNLIIKQLTNKKINILCLLEYDESNFDTNWIINNYIAFYYQGLRIETKPFKSKINIVFYQKNHDNKVKNLIEIINKQPKKLITCISKKSYKKYIINKNKILWNKKNLNEANQKNKTAIITGASGGIGWEIAKLLSNNNWKVYSLSRQEKIDDQIKFIKCNLYDENDVKQKIKAIAEKEKTIKILINNSGYGISGSIENMNQKDYFNMFELNAIIPIKLIDWITPYLNKNKSIIFNIGSMAGVFAIPFQAGYSLTKLFVDLITEILLKKLNKNNISICNIMPGDTKTNFTKNRKIPDFEFEKEYAKRIRASLAQMEKDEIHGHSPKKIAKIVFKTQKKSKIPIKIPVGFKYKILYLLSKKLNPLIVEKVLYEIYAKKEK